MPTYYIQHLYKTLARMCVLCFPKMSFAKSIFESYARASGFNYTLCMWKDSVCVPADKLENSEENGTIRSEWPPGPYALLTPSEGCPESSAHGWRRGYLSFTWTRPQTLTLVTDCDVNYKSDQSCDGKLVETENGTNRNRCWRSLTSDKWPDLQTNLLGPFSEYEWRLNFCFKIGSESITGNQYSWPPGSYNIFGGDKGCPLGFKNGKRTIKLPAVTAWKSYGHLPGFTITAGETDNSVILDLKLCEHQPDENDLNGFYYQSINLADPFIFIKSQDNATCPQFENVDVETETLQLHTDVSDNMEITELFDICYCRQKTLPTDADNYLYLPHNQLPHVEKLAFAIVNPTLIYGNSTSSKPKKSQNNDCSGSMLPSIYLLTTTPWLLVDLGRNFMVVGLQFETYHLNRCDSREYLGFLDRTAGGYTCQRWDKQEPHSHEMTKDEMFSDKTVSDAGNFCRDPTGDGKIWCYTMSSAKRWDFCASEVYNFNEADIPFSRCFVSEERWRMEEFGGILCQYTVFYRDGLLYLNFQRDLEGRYVKLVGIQGMDISKFYSTTKNVQILTTEKVSYGGNKCNIDLGMSDESIYDHLITASSWLPQSPPTSARPFSSGWCADISDSNPYITVDLTADTVVEGITFFNWELVNTHVDKGVYTKKYLPVGIKKVVVYYSNEANKTSTSKTYNLDMFLPVEQPQSFYHEPVIARHITVNIVESMTTNSSCIRLELHGCKQNSHSELVAAKWMLESSYNSGEDSITLNNLEIVKEASIISSNGYPLHYPGGVSYSWIIDFPKDRYVQLIFTKISFNVYDTNAWEQCQDKLTLLSSYEKDSMYIDEHFNGLVTLVETPFSYMIIAFRTCRPTSQIMAVGNGFKAIVRSKAIATCFSVKRSKDNVVNYNCSLPTMFLTSLSRLNFPVSNDLERWTIHVKRYSIHLKILYFNVRCDSGSSLTINDRFSGKNTYCNLNRAPTDWYSDSNIVVISFEKGRNLETSTSLRISATEGFKALYKTVKKPMGHLIDAQKVHSKAVLKVVKLEQFWDPVWKNATLLTYKGCSKKFDKCYYIYSGSITSWKEAGQECWIRKSRLVSLHSDDEQELIMYMLRNYKFFGSDTIETAFLSDKFDPNYFTHIGLSRVTSKTGMTLHLWEDRSPVTFSAWKTDERSTNRDCTRMSFHLYNTNNTWETENCETGLASYFVCEQQLTETMLSISDNFVSHLYNGTLNVTLSGLTCQRWDAQLPNSHYYNVGGMFPEMDVSAAENFCRDPGRDGYIWCYTLSLTTRYDKCEKEEAVDNTAYLYTGKLSRTSSGRTCQRWDQQVPHSHLYGLSSFFNDDSVKDAGNHCRDPSHEEILWCYTTDPNRRWETCNLEDTAGDRCYFTHSVYSGKRNRTISGIACQPWESQTPHDHELFLDSQFPDGSVAEASNYCRDPYNEGFLWCFTMDPATKFEPCVLHNKYLLPNLTSDLHNTNKTFVCENGDVIVGKYICNGIPNCLDLSDETNCTTNVHQLMVNRSVEILDIKDIYSLFQCESKEWISTLARCDSVIDCFDASDEINCSLSQGAASCSSGEYMCEGGGCIHISQMCDFIVDCVDGSDETCDYPLCSKSEYRCRNHQCIPVENRCDAYENCLDGSDEENCDICKSNSFYCDLVRCIPKRLVCDKYIDCKDETDEMACTGYQQIYNSCEEWWNAGFRTSGIYRLNTTEAECNFDAVNTVGTVYTIFHNFEVTARYGMEEIHFEDKDSSGFHLNATHFRNSSYACFQNITQSCIPAYVAYADHLYQNIGTTNNSCACITVTVAPYRYDTVNSSLHFCEYEESMPDINQVLFDYNNNENQMLNYLEGFPSGMEIAVGPAVCSYMERVNGTNTSFAEESDLFPGSVRCVFDLDTAGFIIGSRSGQHLQGCEHYECPKNTVKCPDSFCIPMKFVCDGEIQCPGGQDEAECGCQEDDREVLLLYEDTTNHEENRKIRKIATQFYTASSVVRELRFKKIIRPDRINFDHWFLDISDTVINPYSTIERQFVCNYSILASDLLNRIEFSKISSRGILFFQKSNESDVFAKMIFENLKTAPEFLIYRIIEEPIDESSKPDKFPYVTDIYVKSWMTLTRFGAKYFPDLCKEASTVYCPNEYQCAASKTCIPLEQICDGQSQCLYGDDERACEYTCPENCTCVEYTTDCSFANVDNNTISTLHKNSRLLELSGNTGIRDILLAATLRFPYLISLNLSMCDIKEMTKNIFQSLANLRILDLSLNNLIKIPTSAFIGLRKLKVLNLNGNTDIHSFEPYCMNGLSSIRSVEIIGANIHKLSSYTFAGLNLDRLKLSDNNIQEIEEDVFSGLKVNVIDMENNRIEIFDNGLFRGVSGISSLHTPAFKYCCVRPSYLTDSDCFPEKDEFSSCADLLRLSALQTILWLIGILALLGNILSVIYRLLYDRERLKLGYGIFVTNLAVADFLMGVYLIIIAVADAAFRKRYIFVDDYWRNSAWCTIAGFLSTVSSEASVFFLCLITLDRLLIIKYPFGQVRFNTKNAGIFSGISWFISVSVGLIPILYQGHFQDKFYSKSGVCIALPLTRDRPPGWMYSIVIFVGLNFVTFCLIAVGQVVIYSEIKKATSGIRRSSSRKGKGGPGRRRELAVARNLLLVVTTDFLCWFPIGCMGMMALSGHVIPGEVYAWTAVFILPINSALNPVLYTLTAVLGKKKAQEQQTTIPSHSVNFSRRVKKRRPFKGLFQYFMMSKDSLGLTFVSLCELGNKDVNITSKDVLKIAQNLSRCLCLLHQNSLIVKLDGSAVNLSVRNGKVTGDVQIRQEPSECSDRETKKDNMYELGQVVRLLLTISKRTRERAARCIDVNGQNVGTDGQV